jgi:hypothetical protein
VTRLVLAVMAWRLVLRLAAPAIIIALVMLLLHGGAPASHDGRHAVGAVQRVVQPIEHDLRRTLGKVFHQ